MATADDLATAVLAWQRRAELAEARVREMEEKIADVQRDWEEALANAENARADRAEARVKELEAQLASIPRVKLSGHQSFTGNGWVVPLQAINSDAVGKQEGAAMSDDSKCGEQLGERGGRWTLSKPTEPGWYLRLDGNPYGANFVHVTEDDAGKLSLWWSRTEWDPLELVETSAWCRVPDPF